MKKRTVTDATKIRTLRRSLAHSMEMNRKLREEVVALREESKGYCVRAIRAEGSQAGWERRFDALVAAIPEIRRVPKARKAIEE